MDMDIDHVPREAIVLGLLVALHTLLQGISTRKYQLNLFRTEFALDSTDFLEEETVGEGSIFPGWMRNLREQLLWLRFLQESLHPAFHRRILCPWYIKPRTIEWFYLYIDYTPHDDPVRFKQFFRISPDTFTDICTIVRPDLESSAPDCFHSLPNRYLLVERQVAIAIRRLATGDQLDGIAELFGLSKSTASKVTWKFVSSFSRRARRFLTWPQGRDMEAVKDGFLQQWGFPNCCGAIDATHFLIERPAGESSEAYFDWQRNLSITMQAVVDLNGRFIDVIIGCPGSVADSRLLRRSSLFQHVVHHRTKLNGPTVTLPSRYQLGEYLIGDKGYPLYKWLVTPYPRGVSSIAKQRWNKQHSGARMCVERAFGKLKGIWRILYRKMMKPKIERMAVIVHTCVLLHNMMINAGDEPQQALFGEIAGQPDGYNRVNRANNSVFVGGREAREALFEHVHAYLQRG